MLVLAQTVGFHTTLFADPYSQGSHQFVKTNDQFQLRTGTYDAKAIVCDGVAELSIQNQMGSNNWSFERYNFPQPYAYAI